MNPIVKLFRAYSVRARAKRAAIFRDVIQLDDNTKILDLGSESGSSINAVLAGTPVKPENIYIADINLSLIEEGKEMFGYVPVLIDETAGLPFEDNYFDVVYCSSVIEHVTVAKKEVWSLYSGEQFKKKAHERQRAFADEIKRVGRQYFVQTPYKHFPVESHSWLPFINWLPRALLIPTLKFTNLFWVKKTSPDWFLLDKKSLKALFPEASIIVEKSFGLVKSIMAFRCEPK